MTGLRRGSGRPLILGSELGSGGEARILAVRGEPNLVAKLYHRPAPAHAIKLRAMLANPPADPTRHQGHVSIAWPVDLILGPLSGVAGFLMPRVDLASSVPALELYNPRDRLEKAPAFTWAYLLRTARNFASVVEAVHARGYVVGDLNESNLMVSSSALVTLVDCDSMQVSAPTGERFRCPVGKPEYTPPELQGRDFAAVDRTPAHDNFGLAVLIFMLLMEGVHPFAGVWKGRGSQPTLEENIRAGNCPYVDSTKIAPPRYALPFATLAPELQRLTLRCFGPGHANPAARPGAQQWREALLRTEQALKQCPANSQHRFAGHLSTCPWCERMRQGVQDPFPMPGQQAPLPRVQFGGGPVCPRCKHVNKPAEIFCQRCAAQLRPGRFCTHCGSAALPYAAFCTGCGRHLQDPGDRAAIRE